MTPGALLLRLRQSLSGGPRTVWYREVVRRRILSAAPIPGTKDAATCEVHLLTSADDWMNSCWTLRSFYHVTGANYALCIHDDGTLPLQARETFAQLFPHARLIARSDADAAVRAWLSEYPRCQAFRDSNKLAVKVFDLLFYANAPQLMLVDSDVLFFSYPQEFMRRIEDPSYRKNCANEDVDSAYTVQPADVEQQFGFAPIERFNSGLCVFQKASLRLDWFEEFLGLPAILSHPWRIEQTLLALCSSRFGGETLPQEYKLRLSPGIGDRPVKHYVGAIRNMMYSEGIAILAGRNILNARFEPGRGIAREAATLSKG